MHGDGRVVALDFSAVVVNQMQDAAAIDERHALDVVEYLHMDARDMKLLPSASFDIVIDKGMLGRCLCRLY